MRYPKTNKQLIVVVTAPEKRKLIEASKKSYRTITSIAREGALIVADKILEKEK